MIVGLVMCSMVCMGYVHAWWGTARGWGMSQVGRGVWYMYGIGRKQQRPVRNGLESKANVVTLLLLTQSRHACEVASM